MNESPLLPRLVRFRDAPFYLGMDRNRFNAEVRPQLTEIPIGTQGIAFDRLELDAWVEQYKSRNGRPAQPKGKLTWDEREHPVLSTRVVPAHRQAVPSHGDGSCRFSKPFLACLPQQVD